MAAFAEPTSEDARRDYDALQHWRFAARPAPLPAGGTAWREDAASLALLSGEVRLQEPTAAGAVTGLVFEGEGRFVLEVPDRVELDQLRRFAADPALERFAADFETMVLRSSDPGWILSLAGGEAAAGAGPWEEDRLAADRHDHWLRVHRVDADAAVISGLLDPGARYLRAEMKTREHGWVTFELDSRRLEEIGLWRWNGSHSFLESWVSLDRAADRGPAGRPGAPPPPPLDVEHVAIEARLDRLGKDPGLSAGGATTRQSLVAEISARVRFVARGEPRRALRFFLHPWAEVLAVETADGAELPFLRDPIGRRSGAIDKRVHDLSLVVLLPEPVAGGERRELVFRYELDVTSHMPGRSWYPGGESAERGLSDLHTATLDVALRDGYEARAMGRPVGRREEGGAEVASWAVERPAKMVTFSYGKQVQEQRLSLDRPPEVVVFSPPLGQDTENRLHDVGADVLGSLHFFQNLLQVELPIDRLWATMIQAFHGQAFDGFLHLTEFAAFRERSGPSELFLAHEVAHQWWGHLVGWESYRDQWLSEGLAEYSALLYLEATHPRGEKLFREALEAMADEINGSLRSALSPFARTGMSLMNMTAERRIGPIGHGQRAATGEAPGAYLSLAYHKAALVVHMLRVLSRYAPAGEAGFVAALRDFARTHRGEEASTADFVAAVERNLPGGWGWFFDQWIDHAEVPKYSVKARLPSRAAPSGAWPVRLEIEQKGVPPGFEMPVPVEVIFRDGTSGRYLVRVDGPRVEKTLEVAKRPKKVVFNPDGDILAK